VIWSVPRTLSQRMHSVLPSQLLMFALGTVGLVSGQTTSNVGAVLIGSVLIALPLTTTLLLAFVVRQDHRRQLEGGVLNTLPLTYYPVGETVDPAILDRPPRGFRAGEHRATLGTGRETFDRAAGAVMRWELKTRAGFRVIRVGEAGAFFSDGPVVRGECAVIRFGPVRETVEVVRVVDRPRRRGFAYGTLPDHPLRGEEAFLVEWRDDDTVELVIRAFSRPNGRMWWLLLPVLAIARRLVIRRYLRVLLE